MVLEPQAKDDGVGREGQGFLFEGKCFVYCCIRILIEYGFFVKEELQL